MSSEIKFKNVNCTIKNRIHGCAFIKSQCHICITQNHELNICAPHWRHNGGCAYQEGGGDQGTEISSSQKTCSRNLGGFSFNFVMWHIGNHPQEELTKSGYRSERREKYTNLKIILYLSNRLEHIV